MSYKKEIEEFYQKIENQFEELEQLFDRIIECEFKNLPEIQLSNGTTIRFIGKDVLIIDKNVTSRDLPTLVEILKSELINIFSKEKKDIVNAMLDASIEFEKIYQILAESYEKESSEFRDEYQIFERFKGASNHLKYVLEDFKKKIVYKMLTELID